MPRFGLSADTLSCRSFPRAPIFASRGLSGIAGGHGEAACHRNTDGGIVHVRAVRSSVCAGSAQGCAENEIKVNTAGRPSVPLQMSFLLRWSREFYRMDTKTRRRAGVVLDSFCLSTCARHVLHPILPSAFRFACCGALCVHCD